MISTSNNLITHDLLIFQKSNEKIEKISKGNKRKYGNYLENDKSFFLIFSSSMVLEVFFGEWHNWFSSSGSLLIAIALFNAVVEQETYSAVVNIQRVNDRQILRDQLENEQVSTDEIKLKELLEKSSEARLDIVSDFDKEVQRVNYHNHKEEIIIAIMGTIIWAYGDLMFKCVEYLAGVTRSLFI